MATEREVVSIDAWIIQRGHHPDEVVNGESLHDLLWAFWVFNDDERRRNAVLGGNSDE